MSDPTSPEHYKQKIETWDFIQCLPSTGSAFGDYCRGNVIKYSTRAGRKGNLVTNIDKQIAYLRKWREDAISKQGGPVSDPTSPEHYKQKVETWDFIQCLPSTGSAFGDYCRGNVIKHSTQAGRKGNLVTNIDKQIAYLRKWREDVISQQSDSIRQPGARSRTQSHEERATCVQAEPSHNPQVEEQANQRDARRDRMAPGNSVGQECRALQQLPSEGAELLCGGSPKNIDIREERGEALLDGNRGGCCSVSWRQRSSDAKNWYGWII